MKQNKHDVYIINLGFFRLKNTIRLQFQVWTRAYSHILNQTLFPITFIYIMLLQSRPLSCDRSYEWRYRFKRNHWEKVQLTLLCSFCKLNFLILTSYSVSSQLWALFWSKNSHGEFQHLQSRRQPVWRSKYEAQYLKLYSSKYLYYYN